MVKHKFVVTFTNQTTDDFTIRENGLLVWNQPAQSLNATEFQDMMAICLRIRDWLKSNSGIGVTVTEVA
jgi:predicted Rdx family selenoprotein